MGPAEHAKCGCARHRCLDNGTKNTVRKLRDDLPTIDNTNHPTRQHADQFGIAYPSAAWWWPGADPCCLAAVDIQHAEGEGELQKEWRFFSRALEEIHLTTFWQNFSDEYRAFAKLNRVKQPEITSWNHWRFGQTHENKLTFILRSIGVIRKMVMEHQDELKYQLQAWLVHRNGVELLFRHRVSSEMLQALHQLIIDGKSLCVKVYGESFLSINSHYMTHVPEHAQRFGCSRETSTFGFERLLGRFAMSKGPKTNHRSMAALYLENFWLQTTTQMLIDPARGVTSADDWSQSKRTLAHPKHRQDLAIITNLISNQVWQECNTHEKLHCQWVDYRSGDMVAWTSDPQLDELVDLQYVNAHFGVLKFAISSENTKWFAVTEVRELRTDSITGLPIIQKSTATGVSKVVPSTHMAGRVEVSSIADKRE
ncbi:hypothetical protein DFS34DRAFT_594314 [Phlyctochytrium arcticum]|nr:hypothetical protein DFS34DRAFT_594314 [Phlyctochytrium arcticum]